EDFLVTPGGEPLRHFLENLAEVAADGLAVPRGRRSSSPSRRRLGLRPCPRSRRHIRPGGDVGGFVLWLLPCSRHDDSPGIGQVALVILLVGLERNGSPLKP